APPVAARSALPGVRRPLCDTQFLVFFLRAQPVIALGLHQAQWTSLAVLAALLPMLFIWWKTRSLRTEAGPAVEPGAATVDPDLSAVVTPRSGA
ncbi:MAG TPA: hypothetical protein VNF24_00745, partial [Candidatus Acidoferrales bacterium]|nr:hypothetical protein [Candidatus Acidoferrales bacterium]